MQEKKLTLTLTLTLLLTLNLNPQSTRDCVASSQSLLSPSYVLRQLAVHEWGITILIPGESSRAVHHRPASSVDCHGAGLQVAPEMHSRPSWDPIDYMCCCFRTAPTAFTWTSRRTARRSRSLLWNTTPGDWYRATAGPEHPAVRRQVVPVVLTAVVTCKNGTAAAKLRAVNQNSLRML